MNKNFQRRREDFVCEVCGANVQGNGYTNHCPECLWSKHVDVNPGDRAAECTGLMKPVGIHSVKGRYEIDFTCVKCGFARKNRSVEEDNFESLLKIARNGKPEDD